jgi:hypothetical protein
MGLEEITNLHIVNGGIDEFFFSDARKIKARLQKHPLGFGLVANRPLKVSILHFRLFKV